MKKKFTLLIALCLSFTALCASNFEYQGDGAYTLRYEINEDSSSLTCLGLSDTSKYAGEDDLIIPDTVSYNDTTYPVTIIGESAFYFQNGFTGNLTIGDSVEIIKADAFRYCSGFIGDIVIPNSVKIIETEAFRGCNKFNGNLILGNSLEEVQSSAFFLCGGLTGGLTIPNSVKTIGPSAFQTCPGLTGNLELGDSIVSIAGSAFAYCNFSGEINIPKSVTSLQSSSFMDNPDITAINVDSENTEYCSIDDILYNKDTSELICCLTGRTKEVIIPNVVTYIHSYAFYNCQNIVGTFTIPESVELIDNSVFYQCDKITAIECKSAIPPQAFDNTFRKFNCDISLIVPNQDAAEAYASANGWNNFSNIVYGDICSITFDANEGSGTMGQQQLMKDNAMMLLKNAYEKDGFKFAGWTTTAGGEIEYTEGSEITIDTDITLYAVWAASEFSIATAEGYTLDYVLNNDLRTVSCIGLNETSTIAGEADLVIPTKISSAGIDYPVTIIEREAFFQELFTGGITLGDSIKVIGYNAFNDCDFTSNLILPESLRKIDNLAFANCWELNGNLTIPNSVDTIGESAFYRCNFAGDLTIPNSVIYLGGGAFQYTSFTGNLTLPKSLKKIYSYTFYNCNFTGNLTLPDSLEIIENYAFNNCKFTGELNLPDSLKIIGEYAFRFYDSKSVLKLPNSIEDIRYYAFAYCKFTDSIAIPESVTNLNYQAFYACDSINAINVDKDNAEYCSVDGILYSKDTTLLMHCPRGKNGQIILPNSVEKIRSNAFNRCKNITGEFILPDSLKQIESYAFYNCTGIKSIRSNLTTPPNAWSDAFESMNKDLSIIVPNQEAAEAYASADGWNYFSNYVYGKLYNITFHINDGSEYTSELLVMQNDTIELTASYITDNDIICKGWATTKDGELLYEYGEKLTPSSDLNLYALTLSKELTQTTDEGYEIRYELNDDSASYTCCGLVDDAQAGAADLVIPTYINQCGINYPVTHIKNEAFYYDKFSGSLTLPDSLKTIGEYAFNDCSGFTGNLTLPNSLKTIKQYAFYNCKGFIGNLILPDSLKTIEQNAFYSCSGFTGKLTLPDSVKIIDNYVFRICSGFTSLVIHQYVENIGYGAFDRCNNLNYIESKSNTPPTAESDAFDNINQDINIIVPNKEAAELYAAAEGWNRFSNFVYGELYTITSNANNGTNETNILKLMKDSTTTIPLNKFRYEDHNFTGWDTDASADEVVYIPEEEIKPTGDMSLYAVWEEALLMKTGTVQLTEDVAFYDAGGSLGNYFNDQYDTLIVLPKNNDEVVQLNIYSYDMEKNYDSLYIYDGTEAIAENIIAGLSGESNDTITTCATMKNGGALCFRFKSDGSATYKGWDAMLQSTVEPYRVNFDANGGKGNMATQVIEKGCTESLIPSSFTRSDSVFIGWSTFADGNIKYTNTQEITPNANITLYAIWVPESCTYTTEEGYELTFVINDDLNSYTCTGMVDNSKTGVADLVIPTYISHSDIKIYVTKIRYSAFNSCSGFTGNLVLPDSLKTIEQYAFNSCSGFTGNLVLPDSLKTIEQYAFYNCSGFTGSLVLPDSLKTIAQGTFYNCSGFTGSLVLPDSLKIIKYTAFEDCKGLTSLIIPESVEDIGGSAFNMCRSINYIESKSATPPTTNHYAFYNINQNISIIVPNKEAAELYAAAEGWNRFSNFVYGELYTITFMPCGTNYSMPPQFIMKDSTDVLNPLPLGFNYEGYSFAGWDTDPSADEVVYTDQQEITPNSDLTLYAVWKGELNMNYGTDTLQLNKDYDFYDVGSANSTYYPNQNDTLLVLPDNENEFVRASIKFYINDNDTLFIFDGANTEASNCIDTLNYSSGNDSLVYDATMSNGGALTFVFKSNGDYIVADGWEALLESLADPNAYKVTFDANGGAGAMPTQAISDGNTTPLTANAFVYIGHTFKGWATEADGTVAYTDSADFSTNADTTLYAVWEANMYNITFKVDGQADEVKQVAYGEIPSYGVNNPTKPATAEYSYAFKSWNKEIVTASGDATYTAVFTQDLKVYDITFKVDGQDDVVKKVAYGSTASYGFENPIKAATAQYTYTFDKWNNEIAVVTGEANYTAVFTQTVNEYQITFVIDEKADSVITLPYGTLPTYATTPTKDATAEFTYTFDKWDNDFATVIGDATYTAEFTQTVNKYDITFKVDGQADIVKQVAYGVIPSYGDANPTKATSEEFKYTFTGWDNPIAAVTGNATYTAEFSAEQNSFTLTFHINDGTNTTTSTQTLAYGVAEALNANEFTHNGFEFIGWSLTAEGNVMYNDEAYFTLIRDENLYAVWQAVASLNEISVAPFTQVNNTLYFDEPTQMAVYNVAGIMLYNGKVTELELPQTTAIYIVWTEKGSFKIFNK